MPNHANQSSLPDYENPPLVETVLGVQFDPLSGFQNAHLGAFWCSLARDEWPTISDAPPLEPQFERFTDSARWSAAGLKLTFSRDISTRLQIRNRDGDRMIQVQNGRLHFNWLGMGGGNYPRYEQVRAEFERVLEQFLAFVGRENLGQFEANQWEVTYLNHIPRGTVWNCPEDWTFFRPLASLPAVESFALGESFHGEWHFSIPPERGRLHVSWQHGLQSEAELQEYIVLTLTARGPLVVQEGTPRVLECLDLGHETIVRSFQTLMSEAANHYWGLKHENR